MKTLRFIFLLFLAALTMMACQKEDFALNDELITLRKPDKAKMIGINIKGTFIPDPMDSIGCTPPPPNDTAINHFASNFLTVSGKAARLKTLDPDLSYAVATNCYFEPADSSYIYDQEIYLLNENGDGLILEGTWYVRQPDPVTGSGEFIVVGGYGIFEDADGFMNGRYSAPDFTLKGKVTNPGK